MHSVSLLFSVTQFLGWILLVLGMVWVAVLWDTYRAKMLLGLIPLIIGTLMLILGSGR